ncbi:MAG: hypothetical protein KTR31_20245 [Myxococcales bacterium]|nr:hypothetical protein [Myxococcales bacterium]
MLRLVLFAAFAGCSGGDTDTDTTAPNDTTQDTGDETTDPFGVGETYRQPGSFDVEAEFGTANDPSCPMAYTLYTPTGGPSDVLVVLAHGVTGNQSQLTGWAQHWASWGLPTVVPSLCHSMPATADHVLNAQDMVALAGEIAPGASVAYTGLAQGGLSAALATVGDTDAVGHLAFDSAEIMKLLADNLGNTSGASGLVVSEAGICNAQGNAVDLYVAESAPVIRITGANTCDFTRPRDNNCDRVCNLSADVDRIGWAITTLGTSWLLWQTGVDTDADRWWTPGEASYEALLTQGWVSAL